LQRLQGSLALVAGAITLACPSAATAQTPVPAAPPAPAPAPPSPSLRIVSATLSQPGQDLRLRLRFSRDVPVKELVPAKGRFVCLVLGPQVRTRRRVCVSRRPSGLRATMSPIDEAGKVRGRSLAVRTASIDVDGDVLLLRAPGRALRVKAGRPVTWQALVTWKDGGPCEAVPGSCTQLVPGSGARELRTRAPRGPAFLRKGRLRLLATGDSMIQIIDSFLKQRLERRRATSVRSDARISTGLSKPFMLDWVKKAREQARSVHPDVTAIFIGANDGFPMKTRTGASAACCGGPWTVEYARRVESMMRSYERGGRSYVYWMTLPTPRRGDFARVYRAVNKAIKRAAARVGRGVRVIDLVKVFTPGGRFRQYVPFRGKSVNARQGDGVHLSTAGASIAATLLIDRLRADHALPRLR
jgi:lysophospholipase L1-like esterase